MGRERKSPKKGEGSKDRPGPGICDMKIVDYLVYTTSFVTHDEMRARKGLQSYK